jgi:hypothetical protein
MITMASVNSDTSYTIRFFYMLQSQHHLYCKKSQTRLFEKQFGRAQDADD